jgi:DNA-binding transcriptional LysR family regulator
MHQVTYFLALCEELSFTRAARRCGVAQPSLTRAIQQLEQELGHRLFERSNLGVRLTPLGALVRPDFEQIDAAASRVNRKVADFAASSSVKQDSKVIEAVIGTVAVAVVIALITTALSIHPTPLGTAGPGQARAHTEPYAVHSRVIIKSVPDQNVGGLP